MKFGIQFDFHKIPEWSEHYFDYKALKRMLKKYVKKLNELQETSQKKIADLAYKKKISSKTVYIKDTQEKLLSEEGKEESPKLRNRLNSDSDKSNASIETVSEQDEYLLIWQEKFIEYVNKVNSFFKSKYLENKEEYEALKMKMLDKKKEHGQKHSVNDISLPLMEEQLVKSFKKTMRMNIERDELGIETII